MLPSQAGSPPIGSGSASDGDNTGHGTVVLGSGNRASSVRTGFIVTGLSDNAGSAVGRQRDASGMLGGNGAGVGSRGGARPGNGAGLSGLQNASQAGIGGMSAGVGVPGGARYDMNRESAQQVCSGSEADSDSGDDDDPMGSVGDSRRAVKRERAEMEAAASAGQESCMQPGYGVASGSVTGAKPGKKTRGRVKIKMEFIDNKLRRYTTFSKRKTGIMKKAYELSTLTGTQVLLLVASETGHVYTFATRKLQPMITSETGKALIQTCLNSPDSPPRSDPTCDQRMSATGFEETDLTYQVSESDSCGESKDTLKPAFTVANLPGTSSAQATVPTTSTTMQISSGPSFPITNYLAPVSASSSVNSITSANGTVLKTSAASAGVMQLPSGFTFMPGTSLAPGTPTIPLGQLQQHSLAIQGQQAQSIPAAPVQQNQQAVFRFPTTVSLAGAGMTQQLQAIQVHPTTQQSGNPSDGSQEISQASTSATVSLPATIVTTPVPTSMAGHIYPSPHTVMYASTPALADGSLTVLNAFSQGSSAMQVSTQGQDTGAVPHVFLTAPVSAVQIHPMVIGQQASGGGSGGNLTELQVVNLDAPPHNAKSD
ncbi:serum response factor b isoform X2 [Paramormyrops kingsleyae]|uniref:serum response factor b isoform X2 n=1 Tax=Paramormyrops kingsleyae TaxID=1676925 RepID=UPI000CD64FF9|nr:serum response factor-like isoform X2 [Paramormyrops kingsleyae]